MVPKKIAIFVEGQGELIFVRNILGHLFADIPHSYECLRLQSGNLEEVPYSVTNPNSEVFFKLINVQNDAKVISAIMEREEKLLSDGYDRIIGLRDMYSRKYKESANGSIDKSICTKFIQGAQQTISDMSQPDKIIVHFSIMEVEAWWISMYNLFEKLHESLTEENINAELGYKLSEVDVEEAFFHPAVELTRILAIAGIEYGKKLGDVESITSSIDMLNIEAAFENGRCSSFKVFCEDLMLASGSTYQFN